MNLQDALQTAARAAVHRAGEKLLSYYTSQYDHPAQERGKPRHHRRHRSRHHVLREALLGAFPESGWLSEESPDDGARLRNASGYGSWTPWTGLVEFIRGNRRVRRVRRPWCTGRGAGGGRDLQSRERVHDPLLSRFAGTFRNGRPVRVSGPRRGWTGATVVASRSETRRGLFDGIRGTLSEIRPTGSIAHKLAEVAGGQRRPDREPGAEERMGRMRGSAAGGGGREPGSRTWTESPSSFNQPDTLRNGVIAANPSLYPELFRLVAERRR